MKTVATGGAGFTRPQRLSKLRLAMAGGSVRMYYTYVLRSIKDGNLYIGWTDNLEERTTEHTEGKVSSTKWRRPIELVYYEACVNKEKAIAREKYFKSGFGRRYLQNRIK